MGIIIPASLPKQSYLSKSSNLSAQRLINLFFEPDESGNGKSEGTLHGFPGLKSFVSLGTSEPCWGAHSMGDLLFVVNGNNVYKIESDGAATDMGSIGTVLSHVDMANNGTDVIIVKSDGTAYLVNSSTLVQITDGDFQTAGSVAVLDSFAVFNVLNSGQIFKSASGDASSYDALEVAYAEESPDNVLKVFADHGELWIFGTETIEVWQNVGDVDFPFVPISGAAQTRGLAAKLSVIADDNSIFWLGDDRVVYKARGYTPTRISNHDIEQRIEGFSTINDAIAFSFSIQGHKFYILTFPTESITFAYNMATGLWSEVQSFEKGRWRVNCFAKAFGKNLVGDFETGEIYEIDMNTYTENGDTIQRRLVTPNYHASQKKVAYDKLWIDLETGTGLVSGQGSNPQAMLEYSDDGGKTWSYERWVSMGVQGDYKAQVAWARLGASRQRMFRLTISDPIKVAILDGQMKIRARNA